MKVFTIGFTKKSAEVFFSRLRDAGVQRLIDVRLNNSPNWLDLQRRTTSAISPVRSVTSTTSICLN
jgi:uncharacterized protein (DUF488 family)